MRLIDAGELMEHVWRDKLDSRELIAKMIDNAPTVKEIPTKIPINIFEKLISQEPVLDKIRAEIERMDYLNIEDGSDGYDKYIEQYEVLKIINKYKAKSEETQK